jgi:vacuolar protein sorting-associated protein 16
LKDIFSIGSLEPSAQLFDCFSEYEETHSIQMKYIESLRNDMKHSIEGCLIAACNEFDLKMQTQLLSAASYGKYFLKRFDSKLFVDKCQIVRVLNAMRDQKVGIPITYNQYEKLTVPKLIKRLLVRNEHLLAFKICNYLEIPPAMVVEHWAMEKIKSSQSEEEILKAVIEKMKMSPNASYSKLASIANEYGKKNLALGFLDFEISAGDQVPVLMKMKELKRALQKAIESGETDLIYLVLLDIKEKVEPKILFKIINERTLSFHSNFI